MAISFVGSMVVEAAGASSGTVTANFSSLLDEAGGTPTLQQNDLVLINYCIRRASDAALTPPTGYSENQELYSNGSSHDTNQAIWYKFMGATPDTSVALPQSGSASDGVGAVIHVFRGVGTSTPIDVASATATGIDSTNPDCPAITPSTAGAWIVACGASASNNSITLTRPANLSSTTNHFRQAAGPDTNDSMAATGLKTDWASGSFNPDAFGGGDATAGTSWTAVTLALRPSVFPQTLTPDLFTNSNSFYTPTVVSGGPQDLTPSLFTNSQTFHAATVTRGAVGLTPSLFTNTNTFYNPTVTKTYALTAPLFTNTNTFYSEIVTRGAVNLVPSLFTNSSTFYAATVSSAYTLTVSLFTNSSSFFAPIVTSNYILAPSLLTDGDNFFAATVTPGPVTLVPISPVINSQTFYAPEITAGPVDLTPSLFVNKVGDSGSGSQFFSHYIERVPFHAWTASSRFKRGKPYKWHGL